MNKKAIIILSLVIVIAVLVLIFWEDIKKKLITKKVSSYSGIQENSIEAEKEYEKQLIAEETAKEAENMMFNRSATLSKDINSSADKLLVDFYDHASKQMNNESLSPLTSLIKNNEDKSYMAQKAKQALKELEKGKR